VFKQGEEAERRISKRLWPFLELENAGDATELSEMIKDRVSYSLCESGISRRRAGV